MSTIAERLLLLRGNTKQGDFAQQLGINPNTLRTYENGRSIPNCELLGQICLQFSVSAEWLLLGKGGMFPEKCMQVHDAHNVTPTATSSTVTLCPRCAELKGELEMEKAERRGLSDETRQMSTELREVNAENRRLAHENGDLRERCAKFEERMACGHSGQ